MRAAIALGSNLSSRFGDPDANLTEALQRLGKLGEVLAISHFFRTEPVGYVEQPSFTNAAVLLKTDLEPLPLLRALLGIERDMGRIRADDTPPKGPRIIDLDLLLCENEAGESYIFDDPELMLPHPEMRSRRFVLEPLNEIAPNMLIPPGAQSVQAAIARLNETA